jgi:hypothetical protein
VPCPLPRRIERVRVSIASPLARPSPNGRRVGIRIVTFEMLWGERRGQWHHRRSTESMERPMRKLNDLSRSLTPLNPDGTLIAVIEMSQSSWLVAGIVPGIERHPLKKLEPNEGELLRLLMRWRAEATKMGCTITRIAVAYEAAVTGENARGSRSHAPPPRHIHHRLTTVCGRTSSLLKAAHRR